MTLSVKIWVRDLRPLGDDPVIVGRNMERRLEYCRYCRLGDVPMEFLLQESFLFQLVILEIELLQVVKMTFSSRVIT